MGNHERLSDADTVIFMAGVTKSRRLAVNGDLAAPLLRLDGHGVTIGPVEEPEDMDMDHGKDIRSAVVDPNVILTEVLSAQGFAFVESVDNGVWSRFSSPSSLPDDVDVLVLLDPAQRLYSARGITTRNATLVVYCGDREEAALPLSTAAIKAVRLRDLGTAIAGTLSSELATIRAAALAAVRAFGGGSAKSAADLEKTLQTVVPDRITGYASTYEKGNGQDKRFELATARILQLLVQQVFPLGGSLAGHEVPDGLAIQSTGDAIRPELAVYDCKSKSEDSYSPSAAEGDQQARYLAIQERLKTDNGWRPRGVIMFTPEIDDDSLVKKVGKEAWKQITDRGYQVRFMSASTLWRLWSLASNEPFLASQFSSARFWQAIWDFTLPGVAEAKLSALYGDRGTSCRVVTKAEAELALFAAFAHRAPVVESVSRALQQTEPGESQIARLVSRPRILLSIFEGLRKKRSTLAALSAETGFSELALRFFAWNRDLQPSTAEEWGDHGVHTLKQLAAEAS